VKGEKLNAKSHRRTVINRIQHNDMIHGWTLWDEDDARWSSARICSLAKRDGWE